MRSKLCVTIFLSLGDPVRLRQVLYNLISNAIKFTPAKGWISIDVMKPNASVSQEQHSNNDWVYFAITDSGIGIAPEAQGKLFQVLFAFVSYSFLAQAALTYFLSTELFSSRYQYQYSLWRDRPWPGYM